MNVSLAQFIIKELSTLGVSAFCICPGGRSAPFVEVLSHSKGLKLFYFFEERSAGFFALGRACRDKKAVAVITTSGTAVAELLPSVVEAHYSAVPLVLITADRPLSFGAKGCPQTLKKATSLLKDYCSISKNISKKSDLDLSQWNPHTSSLHLNVSFDEPLIDEPVKTTDFLKMKKKTQFIHKTSVKKGASQKKLSQFFKACKKPLILVGALQEQEREPVKEILKNCNKPIYAESLSNLQGLIPSLLSGEKMLNYALQTKQIDGVIRLGGIPRARFWRDLEKYKLPVLNLSSPPHYEGLARPTVNQPLFYYIEHLKSYLFALKGFGADLKERDQIQLKKYLQLLKKYSEGEEAWFWTLKKSLKPRSKVFLGNSSPIRFWDKMLFCSKTDIQICGQSGVNGIDGLVSRFFGECEAKKNNIAVLGDLSLLYDMPAFWRSKKRPHWTLVVINNLGGQLFSRLFDNPAFLNSHNLSFKALADMWSLNYKCYKKPSDFKWTEPYTLIEVRPKASDTKACFREYNSLWS
ncbi:MAG: 2-succinyl-5-enolpyruvyl-6-hydroxy-3-cyclohexene-1-carboxylic-acid synthase [Oligoflexia bacterium]|nr:2-succinyl-5-enolpyruvyl-6-hydroxy-3-cyclohexene-1-carboxylic-acid synthase [Oligoflexia bacterium]